MKPHKHAELIKAWADGAQIEMNTIDGWLYLESPGWADECEYRIKSELKPDVVKYVHIGFYNEHIGISDADINDGNLAIYFDGETRKLKSAEVLK